MGKRIGNESTVMQILLGTGTSILLCLILTAAGARLLLSEKIGEGSVEVIITVILFLSTTVGNFLTCMRNIKKPLPTAVVNVLVMTAVLFVGGLITDGVFENVLLRIAAVMVGTVVSCVLCQKMRVKPKRKKKHYR